MAYFSIIIPVYNRLDEVRDLLDSLSKQTDKDLRWCLSKTARAAVRRCGEGV